MIYTIGLRERYEQAFRIMAPLNKAGRGVPVKKLGKGIDRNGRPYDGGWVWKSEADARAFIAEKGYFDREVYGVLADWETGTEQKEGEPFRRLLRDSEMVQLAPTPKHEA
jgi:hypothetical protein